MSKPIILVPLDGSKQALAALPVAKALGEIERAALHILHVGEHELTADELRGQLGREASVLDGFSRSALERRRWKFCRSRGRSSRE